MSRSNRPQNPHGHPAWPDQADDYGRDDPRYQEPQQPPQYHYPPAAPGAGQPPAYTNDAQHNAGGYYDAQGNYVPPAYDDYGAPQPAHDPRYPDPGYHQQPGYPDPSAPPPAGQQWGPPAGQQWGYDNTQAQAPEPPGQQGGHYGDDPHGYGTAPQYAQPVGNDFQSAQAPEPYPGFESNNPSLRSALYEHRQATAGDGDHGGYAQPTYDPSLGYTPDAAPPAQNSYDLGGFSPAAQDSTGANDLGFGAGYGSAGAPQQAYGGQPPSYGELGGQAPGGAVATIEDDEEDYEDDDDEYFDDEDDQRSWGRTFFIAGAALLGAILVGGGVTYAYVTFLAPGGKSNNPLIRSDGGPSKVAPKDPGGTQFANRDSKLLDRMDQDRGAAPAEKRVRPVSTLVVRRDGTLVPAPGRSAGNSGQADAQPQQSAPPANQDAAPSQSADGQARVAIPGMTVVLPPPRNQAAPQTPPPAASAPQISNPGAAAPRNVPLPQRNTWIDRSAPVRPDPAPAAAPARAQQPAPAAAAPASASGYVAVLASKETRMEALVAFADLRQKYDAALQGRVPDIQAADLSGRGLGTMYRVVVGPPGSRDAANAVCDRLKTAGYAGCWVKAY